MKSLEQAVAFNASYRNAWRTYLDDLSRAEAAERFDRLTSGLDYESRELCRRQLDIVPRLFPHPLLNHTFLAESAKRDLLPERTADTLDQAGFFEGAQARLDRIQRELDLPEEPLPEMLLHSGLKYVAKQARALIGGKAVIDGGAYIGDTAKLFWMHYAPAVIYALEPEGKTFDTLSGLVEQWGLAGSIVPLRRILSDRRGEEVLWGAGVGASTIKKVGMDELERDSVQTISIDELVEELSIPAIGMIKLDVEGNELAAVRGSVKAIERDRPLLLISIYHTARDFFEIKPFLEELDLGYKFLVRKITDDLMKELVLIGLPETK